MPVYRELGLLNIYGIRDDAATRPSPGSARECHDGSLMTPLPHDGSLASHLNTSLFLCSSIEPIGSFWQLGLSEY